MSKYVECGMKYEIEINKEGNDVGEVVDVGEEPHHIDKKKRNYL